MRRESICARTAASQRSAARSRHAGPGFALSGLRASAGRAARQQLEQRLVKALEADEVKGKREGGRSLYQAAPSLESAPCPLSSSYQSLLATYFIDSQPQLSIQQLVAMATATAPALLPPPQEPASADLYLQLKQLQEQLRFVEIQEAYIKDEQKNLKRELLRAEEEVKRIQSVPLVIGQVCSQSRSAPSGQLPALSNLSDRLCRSSWRW